MDASLITVSYRGDLDLACELCASADRFVEPTIEHVLIVPRRDMALFAPLAGGRRKLISQESLLPRFWIPLPTWLRRLPLIGPKLRRDVWLTPRGPVRGWIMQQIIKLSCDRATDREILIFADSDLVFVRPLTPALAQHGDKVRLYHRPGETKDSASHRRWHKEAARLLGLPKTDYFGADYIGQLVVWRRSVLQKLHARIAQTEKQEWRHALCRSGALSEYILYGVFAEHVLGAESGHYCDTQDWTHASWHYDETPAGRASFLKDFSNAHIAVLLQSTMDLPVAERREIIAKMSRNQKEMA